MRFGKTLLAVVAAAAVLGALVGSASANRLSTTSQTWRVTFARLELRGAFAELTCPITFEGSFHSATIAKSPTLVGYVARAVAGACSFGSATLLTQTLPWHVRYGSFGGTLPSIGSLTLNLVGFAIRTREASSATCLMLSMATEPLRLRFTRETTTGALTEAEAEGVIPAEIQCLSMPVPLSGRSSSVSVQGGTTRITVTLI